VTEGTKDQDRGVGRKSSRTAAWLAWSLAAVSLVLLLAGITLFYLSRSAGPGSVNPAWLEYAITAMFATYPTVGAVVAYRRPTNAVGWLLCVVGLAIAVANFTDVYAHYADDMALAGAEAAAFLSGINPGVAVAIFVPLVFPDGRLPSRRWRLLVWLIGAGLAIYAVDAALEPGGPDPLGVELPPNVYGVLVVVQIALFVVGILGAAASVALRLWRARGQERQQLKWLVYATSVAMVGMLGAVSFQPPLGDFFFVLTLIGFAAMPVAVGVAVLRYNLYDIDLVINRTLVYGSLTAMLVALYFVGIVVLQRVFIFLTGQRSTLAVVASTLLIAALFTPLRRRIQGFIDRRFYRRKYDARKTLEAFSAQLRNETDLEALSDDLVGVVRETMQPAHVSLWLRPDTPRNSKRVG
jgi:hypothetical protein